ncbi:MAG: hypothetical protein E7012_01030 [Alphaproteobacteria bacterium]|nr:hypothetical protein [Alphaproteobacteria bacterium]
MVTKYLCNATVKAKVLSLYSIKNSLKLVVLVKEISYRGTFSGVPNHPSGGERDGKVTFNDFSHKVVLSVSEYCLAPLDLEQGDIVTLICGRNCVEPEVTVIRVEQRSNPLGKATSLTELVYEYGQDDELKK